MCPYCDKCMSDWNEFNRSQHLRVCIKKNPSVSKNALTNWFSPSSSRTSVRSSSPLSTPTRVSRTSSISLNFPYSLSNSPSIPGTVS